MYQIFIDTYDAGVHINLPAETIASHYQWAVLYAFPYADVRTVCDGKGVRVYASEEGASLRVDLVADQVREIIGSTWQTLAEQYPVTEEP